MELSPSQLDEIRVLFTKRFNTLFPSTEYSPIYERVKNEMDSFLREKINDCKSKKELTLRCACDEKICKNYIRDKASLQLTASQKQLCQLLYLGSEKVTFWRGFIEYCCLFLSIDFKEFAQEKNTASNHITANAMQLITSPQDSILIGKWKYICTSFSKDYQHGGRFIIKKTIDGHLVLQGQRMWRDTLTVDGKWDICHYKESEYLIWNSIFIFMKNENEIYIGYKIPEIRGNILGLMMCNIDTFNDSKKYITGNFYVLSEVLCGTILFKEVSDEEYHSNETLPKNH